MCLPNSAGCGLAWQRPTQRRPASTLAMEAIFYLAFNDYTLDIHVKFYHCFDNQAHVLVILCRVSVPTHIMFTMESASAPLKLTLTKCFLEMINTHLPAV